jgi:multidrug resistance efflux pump
VLPVRAQQAGVVETLAVNNGGWLEEGELALTVIDPAKVRFHAEAPQSDIALFRDGQQASVVPPQGSSVDVQSALPRDAHAGPHGERAGPHASRCM